MNAAVLHAVGEAPRYGTFADPVAGEGEVMVEVSAVAVKQLDRARASGRHYSGFAELPAVGGTDGVGRLEDGTRVLCGGVRPPFGMMAELAAVPRAFCLPLPNNVDDAEAAAANNSGISAWMSLRYRAQMEPGENVLVLGATGTTGRMAVQLAREFGAGRVVAAGRNRAVLDSLLEIGADATIELDQPDEELSRAFAREGGFNVVIDHLWGRPVEVLLATMTRHDMSSTTTRSRIVQVGDMAGTTASIPAGVLRSSRLEILGSGTGNFPARAMMAQASIEVMELLAAGKLRVAVERVPLANVEQVWKRGDVDGRRVVLVP